MEQVESTCAQVIGESVTVTPLPEPRQPVQATVSGVAVCAVGSKQCLRHGQLGVGPHQSDAALHRHRRSPPIKQHPYRSPMIRREQMAKLIDDMQRQGIMQPTSSPWANPVVLVPKKDGTTRFCVDYRHLNAGSHKDVYPLPRIEDILSTLGEAKYFSTLDLSSGYRYWQCSIS